MEKPRSRFENKLFISNNGVIISDDLKCHINFRKQKLLLLRRVTTPTTTHTRSAELTPRLQEEQVRLRLRNPNHRVFLSVDKAMLPEGQVSSRSGLVRWFQRQEGALEEVRWSQRTAALLGEVKWCLPQASRSVQAVWSRRPVNLRTISLHKFPKLEISARYFLIASCIV